MNQELTKIINLIRYKSNLTQKEIAASLGVRPTYLSDMINARIGFSQNFRKKIYELYPYCMDLSNVDGDMLQERAAETQPMMIPTNAPSGIPLITAEAMAGALVGESYVYPQDCPRFIVPAFNNPNFLISVCGDSMEPLFRTGDIVACKTMPLSSVFFQWGKVYVVNTQQGALIKRVEPGDSNDAIVLVSDNERYKPFAIPKSEIYQIALVVGLIRPL